MQPSVHREDTNYSCEQFQGKLPVGSWLDICTTVEMTRLESDIDGGAQATGNREVRLR
jgi:hypothetical protein